jgi:O-antigen/teichoic acid export membrane protein
VRSSGPSLLRRLRRDLLYYVPSQLLGTVLNLAAVAVFTRLLDRPAYGSYIIVVSGALMLNEFVFGWFQASALRYWYARSREGQERYDRFVSSLLAVLGVLMVGAALTWPILTRTLFSGTSGTVAWLGFLYLFGLVATRVVLVRTRAVRELRALFWYSLAPQILNIGLGVALVKTVGPRADVVLLAACTGSIVCVLLDLSLRYRHYIPRHFSADRGEVRLLLEYGLPILVTSIGSMLLFFSDRFLIAHFSGISAAGLYVIGYNLAFKLDIISMTLLSGSFPLLVQDYESRPAADVGASLARLIAVFCALGVPAIVGFALVMRPLANVMLGKEFREAVKFVMPLLPGVFAYGLSHYFAKPFQLAARNRPQIVVQIVAALPQLVLNLILLPRFGPVAAAYTNSAALIILSVMTYLLSRRHLPYGMPWGELARIGAAAAVMVAVVLVVTAPLSNPILLLVLRIVLGIAVYGATAVALDVVGVRRQVARVWRRSHPAAGPAAAP